MFEKTRDLVALDLGAHSIKMMMLSRSRSMFDSLGSRLARFRTAAQPMGQPLRLVALGVSRLPRGTIIDGKIDRPDQLVNAIRVLADHLGIGGKSLPVAIALTGYEVMIKKVTLPTMTEEGLEKRMTEELGQYVPYPVAEVNIDYEIIGISKDKTTHMDVILVAAKRTVVDEYVAIIQQTGLEPAVIDVDFFALANAFEAAYGVFPEQTIGLADIGAARTSLGIIHQGVLTFTQDIPMGGQQLDDSIQAQFRDDSAASERIKLGGAAGVDRTRLEAVLREVVRGWAGNLRRTIEFFHKNYVETQLDKLYLCGGSARIPGLTEFFRQELGTEVEVFNPLKAIAVDPQQFDPQYLESIGPQMAVCLGLSLRQTSRK